jgi:hypothetical protein
MNHHMIQGGRHVDERGNVSFVNDFDFKGVDRFYWVQPAHRHIPRGWVGHQRTINGLASFAGKCSSLWFSRITGSIPVGTCP